MPTIQFGAALPVESGEVVPLLTAIRTALVGRLAADAPLTELLGGSDRIFYRPRRSTFTPPELTYFDFGGAPDPLVPVWDRTVQIDIWETDLDRAERIATRIRGCLDLGRRGGTATPFVLDGTAGRVATVLLTGDREASVDEDVVRKSLDFRILAYDGWS